MLLESIAAGWAIHYDENRENKFSQIRWEEEFK
jgi:hypothetical protein